MKFVNEFRSRSLTGKLVNAINGIMPEREVRLMEVCGTHTASFYRFGLDRLIPPGLKLISGPGCPVCVTAEGFIDAACGLAKDKDTLVLSFGDMLRVPGSNSSLEEAGGKFSNVRLVYSPLEALKIAADHPGKKVVFLAVGFETTAGSIALTVLAAKKKKLKNLFFYSALKLIPPAMEYILSDPRQRLDGFLCPGHVSAIIGTRAYAPVLKKYRIPLCVAGFEPVDILEGFYLLLKQIKNNSPRIDNQYRRVVRGPGNIKAQRITGRVFRVSDAPWRGLGGLPLSGLKLKKEFAFFDAKRQFSLKENPSFTRGGRKKCGCADVLKGLLSPRECPLFFKACTPENPYGPCMVSREGACNAYFKYRR